MEGTVKERLKDFIKFVGGSAWGLPIYKVFVSL